MSARWQEQPTSKLTTRTVEMRRLADSMRIIIERPVATAAPTEAIIDAADELARVALAFDRMPQGSVYEGFSEAANAGGDPSASFERLAERWLRGLVAADAGSGEIRLLDHPVPAALPEVIGSVGALVETPLFFPGFTGRLNLQLLAEASGSADAIGRAEQRELVVVEPKVSERGGERVLVIPTNAGYGDVVEPLAAIRG